MKIHNLPENLDSTHFSEPYQLRLKKISIISQALLCSALLYIVHSALFFELQNFLSSRMILWEEQQSSALLLLQERLLYALVYMGGGWVFFYRKLRASPRPDFVLKLKDKKLSTALLWGLGGGALSFTLLLAFLSYGGESGGVFDFNSRPEGFGKDLPLRVILQKDSSTLLWHLLFSALLTAIVEEGYYRACLQNYLQRGLTPFLSVSTSAFVFALAHGNVFYFMLLPAFIFSILFWKQGLLSAIMAHAVYNALILSATARGY